MIFSDKQGSDKPITCSEHLTAITTGRRRMEELKSLSGSMSSISHGNAASGGPISIYRYLDCGNLFAQRVCPRESAGYRR
jgi:hypothetical protein